MNMMMKIVPDSQDTDGRVYCEVDHAGDDYCDDDDAVDDCRDVMITVMMPMPMAMLTVIATVKLLTFTRMTTMAITMVMMTTVMAMMVIMTIAMLPMTMTLITITIMTMTPTIGMMKVVWGVERFEAARSAAEESSIHINGQGSRGLGADQ